MVELHPAVRDFLAAGGPVKFTEPTEKDLLDIDLLKRALPPISVDCWPGAPLDDGTSRVCIDLEWDPEEPHELWTVGIGNESWVAQFGWQGLAEKSRDILRKRVMYEIACHPVVMHNAASDIKKLRANGFPIIGPANFLKLDDSMLLHAVLHSEEEHTLEYLSLLHGVLPPHKHLKRVRGAASVYNAADLVQTCAAMRALEKEAAGDLLASAIYRSMSLPFIWLAIEGEEAGIRVSPGVPQKLFEKFDQKRTQATLLIGAYCGWPVNLNSPDQVKHVLYNLEGLPIQREQSVFGQEGKATTDKEAIAALRRMQGTEWDEDEPATLLQAWTNILAGANPALEAKYLFTHAQQVVSHYIEPCLGKERIYPDCKQHTQASGRHSYTGPAMSQLKGELDSLVTPDLGTCWVGHDWSQIEARILAAEANDPVYLEEFARADSDIHERNVRSIFGPRGSKELEEIRRGFVKRFVFRLHYQGKAENAGNIPGTRALGLDGQRLVDASNKYLGEHPALVRYWDETKAIAERDGMIRTFMGRPRRLTGLYQAQRGREACNQPMQGGVADIYVQTALLVKAAAPWARLVWGSFDAQWWQIPVARKVEFLAIYAPIVEREFEINGIRISFPASYKTRGAAA